MSFPQTPKEYKEQGYKFRNWATCRGCNAKIGWVETPRGKFIPIDPEKDGKIEVHWTTCPAAGKFRKNKQ